MQLYRYNCTLHQLGLDDVTLSIVAKSSAQAREKAHYRLTNGLPFHSWKPSQIRVRKLESVDHAAVLS